MTNLSETTKLFDLSELGVVIVKGGDATSFLQGQLSNDISHLSNETPHQLSAYCNPKGRMLALFHVLMLDTRYALIAPKTVLKKVIPRLKMFVMRAAVSIEQDSNIHLLGVQCPDDCRDFLAQGNSQETKIANHTNDPNRCFIFSETPFSAPKHNINDWNLIDIIQHLPQVFEELHEALIPQSLNLDIIGGVNFKKGCYPGQEIIARVKYRGKPKTRMISVSTTQTTPIDIGAPIYIAERDRSAGTIINVANAKDTIIMSVTVPVTHISEGKLYLDETRTIELERLACPYEITV